MAFFKSKENTLPIENQTESEEKLSTTWNPNYDEYLKLRFDIPKGDEEKISKSLESSYGRLPSIEQAQDNLEYLKGLLNNDYEDDAVFEMMNSEKIKYERQKDEFGKKGFNSTEYRDADIKLHAFIGHTYKTTRGFLEFRIWSLQQHIDDKIKLDQNKENENDQIKQVRNSIKEQ